MDVRGERLDGLPHEADHAAIEAAANEYAQRFPPAPPPPELETPAQRSAWALEIASGLIALRNAWADLRPAEETVEINECWVGAEDLALYVRYKGRRGHRVPDLHLDVWLGGPATAVVEQASDVYHDLEAGGDIEFVDDLGFGWFGEAPTDRGWRWAIHDQPRLTAPLPDASPLEWAFAAADALVRLAADERVVHPHDPVLEDCQVGEDLALYTRYRYNGELRGHRAADLGRERLQPEFGLNARNLARQIWLELGAAAEAAYVDQAGYRWSGDDPEAPVTWEYVIERMPPASETR